MTSLLSTIWRKQSGKSTCPSLTIPSHRQQQPYRPQGMDEQSARPTRTRYTGHQSPRQFPSQSAQQPRTAWTRQNRQPLTSGEQQQCYRCLKNHHPKNCSFANATCFHYGITGHIKAACRRRLALQNSQ